jgi:hypothetical protein
VRDPTVGILCEKRENEIRLPVDKFDSLATQDDLSDRIIIRTGSYEELC